MNDITTLLQVSAKHFQTELNRICSTITPKLTYSLNLFSQLVCGKNYSEMVHYVKKDEYKLLVIPALRYVVNELNKKGEKVTTDEVSHALINAIGRNHVEMVFPFLCSVVTSVKDPKSETLNVNFRNIGLIATDEPGYYPITSHNFRDDEYSDAETFMKVILNQSTDDCYEIITKNHRLTATYTNKRTLYKINHPSFAERAANALLSAVTSEFGNHFVLDEVVEKLQERHKLEELISDTLSHTYRHDTFVCWEEEVGGLFVMLLAQSIDNDIKYFEYDNECCFDWKFNYLESVITNTKQVLVNTLNKC
ncbi:hypothetical protein [Vibrio parahaemolyticus]|uniref:hypothetical protein n=1 Tax=Vibrio parahaemolyticus TaxID=670 RepID=UPI000D52F7EE|nr:hypothetical protein [Vibrio parahaemolyticus]AWG77745.1 hypothetical protein C9I78_02420 [Vibrio parahaemolyticus]AWJ77373.1 hypothetical protein C7Y67_02540 [Vibrio parahaemolyticus]